MSGGKRVFTIPANISFLPCLARFVLDGALGDNSTKKNDPLLLSNTTIYLPTRRAVRALRAEFSNQLGTRASLLPNLRTLGDSEETDFLSLLPNGHLNPPKQMIAPLTRQILLARLVKRWVEMISAQTRELYKDEDIIIPSSSAEALWLAREVSELIDQMETEEVSWENLKNLIPLREEYANWWQLTLDFLQIAMKHWPEHLAQINACDPASHRRQILDLRTRTLQQNPPSGPVIAAGSTGSIPATARFLSAVSELPLGSVILPGLDQSMSNDAWNDVSSGSEDHPQFGLSKLIQSIAIPRENVIALDKTTSNTNSRSRPNFNRSKLSSIALLPSSQTGNWRNLMAQFQGNDLEQATNEISIIEAASERHEALAIAIILRDQVENPDINIALITPDRNLARRVVGELKRFDLAVDDSGGTALSGFANSIFLRLLIIIATQPPDAIALATFVKHPMLTLPTSQNSKLPLGRLFELCLLRNVLEIPLPGNFAIALLQYREATKNNPHLPDLVSSLTEENWRELHQFCKELDTGFSPLVEKAKSNDPVSPIALEELFEKLLASAGLLVHDEENSLLFADEAGNELAAIFEEITSAEFGSFSCHAPELLSVFNALTAGKMVRQASNTHPRISILGPLEARLQPLDAVIVSGLNEGTWPARHDSGPFLNRPMKLAMELATPERRTGLAAHDFEQLLGYHRVFLTRSQRVDNAPTVPSRWLQRLITVCGTETAEKMKQRGEKFLDWGTLIDTPSKLMVPIERPCPKPPLAYRPNRLSVTEVETWIRDPYAIYARRVLCLLPLPPIGLTSEHALKGTILHDAAAEFITKKINLFLDDAADRFMEITRTEMAKNKVPDYLQSLWLPRFEEIADAFIKSELKERDPSKTSHCEISGEITVGDTGFKLRGRADRIDILVDGSVEIIDYKTGSTPSKSQAQTLSPQLALEGAMVQQGGFAEIGKRTPTALQYVSMKPQGKFKLMPVNDKEMSAEYLSNLMLQRLNEQIIQYKDPQNGYISRFAVARSKNISGDYDHLARVREWSLGDDNDAENFGEGNE